MKFKVIRLQHQQQSDQISIALDEFHEQLVDDIGTTPFRRILRKLLS